MGLAGDPANSVPYFTERPAREAPKAKHAVAVLGEIASEAQQR